MARAQRVAVGNFYHYDRERVAVLEAVGRDVCRSVVALEDVHHRRRRVEAGAAADRERRAHGRERKARDQRARSFHDAAGAGLERQGEQHHEFVRRIA